MPDGNISTQKKQIMVYYFRSFHSVDSNTCTCIYMYLHVAQPSNGSKRSRAGNLLPKHGLQHPLPPKLWSPVEIIFINDNFDCIPVTHFSSVPCESWLQHRHTFNHYRNVRINVPFLRSFLWGMKNCFSWCRSNGYCPEITFCYYTDHNPVTYSLLQHTHTSRNRSIK